MSDNINKSSVTVVDLLRHGEYEGDTDVFRGSGCNSDDDFLSDYGWQQMVKAIEGQDNWDYIVSSPQQVCREFAELVASEESIDLEVNSALEEIDFGLWEGLTPIEIIQNDANLLNSWWQTPTTVTPPEGEEYQQFRARVLIALKELIQNNKESRILLVTHAGVIRTIMTYLLGMNEADLFRINVNYAGFTRLHIHHDKNGDWASLVLHC